MFIGGCCLAWVNGGACGPRFWGERWDCAAEVVEDGYGPEVVEE